MTRPVHLGLDVGGTASRWVACDEAGEVLARGKTPGATGHIFNPAERERLAGTIAQIAAELAASGLAPRSLAAGLTGYGSAVAAETTFLLGATFGLAPEAIILTDDIVLAYMAGFAPGEGHLVSAGTGSIGLHLGEGDAYVRVGGRGILIDDAGSGSWIALRALDAMYRALDHTGSFAPVQLLAQQVLAAVGGAEWHDVRQFVYAGDRGRIGSLAVAVASAAGQGDHTALSILARSGIELAQLARALIARVGDRPIGFAGGVLTLHPIIVETIRRELAGHEVRLANGDAALAAAQLQTQSDPRWRQVLASRSSIS
ncbi:MAG TPA: BadF/BadG/BcrA/BcrD ATPase family protein [Devosia sp.]|nr:BadF/BadG/BcrA/BcrD ATPase family protein [Devosia sp.]